MAVATRSSSGRKRTRSRSQGRTISSVRRKRNASPRVKVETSGKKGRKRKVSAWPSRALLSLVASIAICCVYSVYKNVSLKETSPPPTSPRLFVLRLVFTVLIFGVEAIEISREKPLFNSSYKAGSMLKPSKVYVSGFKQLSFFTHWSWLLLGAYFASTLGDLGDSEGSALSSLLWEVAAPNACLVTTVVTFVIWPTMLKKGEDTTNIKQPVSWAAFAST